MIQYADEYALCIHNQGYEGCLEIMKLYPLLPPIKNDPGRDEMVRVVDESEEDYLYPADWFVPLKLTDADRDAIREASQRTEFSKYFADEQDASRAAG